MGSSEISQKVKIVVTGNCQARAVGAFLSLLPGVEIIDIIILHLSDESQEDYHREIFAAAHKIVAQQTSESFLPRHLRCTNLKAEGQTIVWPNIFFCGQQPFLRYITSPTKGRLTGPLDVYHDIRILDLWYSERFGGSPFPQRFDNQFAAFLAERSLQELEEREGACDITISEKIRKNWQKERLFFTFNHPSSRLLSFVANTIGSSLGIQSFYSGKTIGEPLNKIIAPSTLESSMSADQAIYQGVNIRDTQRKQTYCWDSLVAATFDAYDQQQDCLLAGDLRFTPNYS